jgi:hypothetical protein
MKEKFLYFRDLSATDGVSSLNPPRALRIRRLASFTPITQVNHNCQSSTSWSVLLRRIGFGTRELRRCRSQFRVLRRPTCRSHAVCTACHVQRSLKLPTTAQHVVECTFRRGLKSYSAHHIFSRACRGINAESPTHNLTHNPPACMRG